MKNRFRSLIGRTIGLVKKIKRGWKIAFISILALYLYFLLCPLPSLRAFKKRNYSTRIESQEGDILYISSTKNGLRREYSSLKKIPRHVQKAFIKAEDRRFYFHPGFDAISLTRAIFQDITEKRTVSGASTITMQLSRIIVPSEKRTIFSKIVELDRALKIEARLSKRKILELYLNSIPFGNNVEGVTSGARYYFSKDVGALTREEAYLLSIIPRRPKAYNPIENPETAAKKASEIFKVSEEELLKIARAQKRYEWPFKAEHLVQKVLKEEKASSKSKSSIKLSVSSVLQDFASYSLQEALRSAENSRIHNASCVVLDNNTGKVLCWIGNPNWSDHAHSGSIDGVEVKNQMGSSMKPFLYAAALENEQKGTTNARFFPYMILDDIPMEFGSTNIYLPKNFNNRTSGPVLFRQALASSLNIPAVYILSRISVPHYAKVLSNLGFSSLKGKEDFYSLGLSLGAGEVTLLELTRAFSVFPNDGLLKDYSIYSNQYSKNKAPSTRVYEEDTARILSDMLSDKDSRSRGFGYVQTFQTSYPSMFKTGTANQYQSIVALGATPDYTVGVWMGNFSGNTVIGKTGSSLPAKCAREILDFLTEDNYEAFKEPKNYTKLPICPVSGLYPGEACPGSVMEYVKNSEIEETKLKKCSWHLKDSEGNLITEYPAQYQEWLSKKRTYSRLNYTTSNLEITTPKSGSVFYLKGDSSELQKIPVSVQGGKAEDEALKVLYDGRPLTDGEKEIVVERPFSFVLPVERGFHTLEVRLGEESSFVSFEVR